MLKGQIEVSIRGYSKPSINNSAENVKKILGKDFLRTRRFSKLKLGYENKNNPIAVLKCDDNFRNYVLVAFGSLYNHKEKCVLSTIAFRKDISCISKSLDATAIRDAIVNDITERLKIVNPKFTITLLKKTDDIVSVTAHSYIQSVTQSKIGILLGFLRRITPFFRRAIYITVFIFIILSIACYLGYLDVNNYIAIIIPTIIALIIEVGIPLKDELSIKKIDEFS